MIMGMGHAYFAARSIDQFLSEGRSPFDSRWRLSEWIQGAKLMDDGKPAPSKPKQERVKVHEREPMERNCNFEEVEQTMSREEAWEEALSVKGLSRKHWNLSYIPEPLCVCGGREPGMMVQASNPTA